MIIQGIRYASDFEAKKLMIEIGKSLDEKGYTLAQDGSMSVRVGPNAVWITIQDSENGALTQGDFIRVDLNGKSMNHSPDACLPEDLEIHLKIYRENPKIQGVIHAYPVCAVVLQQDKRGLEACGYTPSVRSLGKVTLIPSGDSAQTIAAAALAAKSDKGVLLENDGCLMWGSCVREAYRNIRLLDYCAQVRSRMGECCGTEYPGSADRTGGIQSIEKEIQKTVSPTGSAQTASEKIPGLTGLYHPAGGARSLTQTWRRPALQALCVQPGLAQAGSVQAGAAQTGLAQVPGLTGLYHPAGGRSFAGTTQRNPSAAGFVPEGHGQAEGVKPSRPAGEDPSSDTIRTAAPDPVKDSTMAEVIRKSMSKMGKGGL